MSRVLEYRFFYLSTIGRRYILELPYNYTDGKTGKEAERKKD